MLIDVTKDAGVRDEPRWYYHFTAFLFFSVLLAMGALGWGLAASPTFGFNNWESNSRVLATMMVAMAVCGGCELLGKPDATRQAYGSLLWVFTAGAVSAPLLSAFRVEFIHTCWVVLWLSMVFLFVRRGQPAKAPGPFYAVTCFTFAVTGLLWLALVPLQLLKDIHAVTSHIAVLGFALSALLAVMYAYLGYPLAVRQGERTMAQAIQSSLLLALAGSGLVMVPILYNAANMTSNGAVMGN